MEVCNQLSFERYNGMLVLRFKGRQYGLMLKIHAQFLQDISLIINQHLFLFKISRETK